MRRHEASTKEEQLQTRRTTPAESRLLRQQPASRLRSRRAITDAACTSNPPNTLAARHSNGENAQAISSGEPAAIGPLIVSLVCALRCVVRSAFQMTGLPAGFNPSTRSPREPPAR